MRLRYAHTIATTLCALALVLACAATSARAAPKETQASNTSHARAGTAGGMKESNARPPPAVQASSLQPASPSAVRCVFARGPKMKSRERRITIEPGQNPDTACPPGGKPATFYYREDAITPALQRGDRVPVRLSHGLPPPGKPRSSSTPAHPP